MTNKITLRLVFSLMLISGQLLAQAQPAPGNINTLISKIGAYNSAMPVEKVFLQLDKPYYSTDDTVWFKAYLLNQTLAYSPLSSRLYVELLNDSNAVMKRYVLPMAYGLTWGSIPLDATYIHEGTYTVRAYTNWMRNFSDDYFFKQSFYVNNKGENTWLVKVNPALTTVAGKDNAKIALSFSRFDNKTSGLRDLQLTVLNGKKVLSRVAAQTDVNGAMNVDFNLPATSRLKNLTILAQDKLEKKQKAVIPIKVNRAEDVDLQFMPEGGSLVVGIPAHVGFKATGEDGKGITIQGTVYDNNHNSIAEMSALHYGIGTFDIVPQPNTTYSAEITLASGSKKTIPLPVPLKTGTSLKIKNRMGQDTMAVNMFNNADQSQQTKYYLIGMSRGVVCFGASLSFNNNYFSARVPKSLFPTGIAHFILLNAAQQPINERITFINHDDNLKIDIKTDAGKYSPRDSVPVHIRVTDENGKAVVGAFSMAVTDNEQVKPGSAISDNILSHMLLSSDLKGYVEDPSYYFEHTDQAWSSLDALLLTQGWVGYDLRKIDQPLKPAYDPEVEFAVKGTVTNLFNKPIANATVLLLAKGGVDFVKDTVTNTEGKFVFRKLPSVDKATFILSARNAKGKIINGGISVDEKNQSPVTGGAPLLLDPWNVNTDTAVLNYVKLNKTYHENLDKALYGTTGKLLRAINVNERAAIKGSKNLNGPEGTDQTITEETMVNAGKATLLDVITDKVKGFHSGFFKDSTKKMNLEYFIKDKRVHFVFDGIDLDRFYEPFGGQPNEHYDYQKQYLDYIAAADILGVEVIYSQNGQYNIHNIDAPADLIAATGAGPMGSDYAYLEITTRAGNGPFIQKATGIYVYRPLPLAEFREFYRPRYPVKNAPHTFDDLRSTIHWAPNIITDKSGTSTVGFYAADKPTQYTIIIEGSDLNGRVGYQTKQITIGR